MIITDQALMLECNDDFVADMAPLHREIVSRYSIAPPVYAVAIDPTFIDYDGLADFLMDEIDEDDIDLMLKDEDYIREMLSMNEDYIDHLIGDGFYGTIEQAREQNLCLLSGYRDNSIWTDVAYAVHPQGFLFDEDEDLFVSVSRSFIDQFNECVSEAQENQFLVLSGYIMKNCKRRRGL